MVYLIINYNEMASLKYFVISYNSPSSPCTIMNAIISAEYSRTVTMKMIFSLAGGSIGGGEKLSSLVFDMTFKGV